MVFGFLLEKQKTLGKPKNPKVSGPSERFWILGFLVLGALEPIQRAACLIGNGSVVRALATDLVPESQSEAKLLRGRTIDLRFEPIPAQQLCTLKISVRLKTGTCPEALTVALTVHLQRNFIIAPVAVHKLFPFCQ